MSPIVFIHISYINRSLGPSNDALQSFATTLALALELELANSS